MATLESGVDITGTDFDIYLHLGLNSCKGSSQNRRILSLVASFLEISIQNNERMLKRTKKTEVTIFHGLRAPSLSIKQYIARIGKYAKCSISCFIIACIYIGRFLNRQPEVHLTSLNVHRLLITSVMVAAKFVDDAFFNNLYYAKVGGVTGTEMNRLELQLLFRLDFRLQVTEKEFVKYCFMLEKEAIRDQIERPIQNCGFEDRITEKTTEDFPVSLQLYNSNVVCDQPTYQTQRISFDETLVNPIVNIYRGM